MVCAFLVVATISPGAALADPELPDTASEAAQQVSEMQRELEMLSEQRNEARVALDQHIAETAAATVALGEVNAAMATIDGKVRAVARSAFAGDRLGSFSAILTSDSPQEFLDRVNTLEYISGKDAVLLAQATQTRDQAQALKDTAEAAVASSQATVNDIAARSTELETKIETYRNLFGQLSPDDQQLFDGPGGGPQAPPGPILAPTEAARIAVETAYAQLGDRYVYGAAGPNSFDCSGLTMFAYAQAGVRLPHSSRSQSALGVPVSRGDLQPGDLVFYYQPVSHVAIYVGNGQIIHASNESRPVTLESVDPWGAYNSARRITG